MEFALIWIGFAVVTSLVASSRGRSGAGWFALGLLFSFLALILVALLPSQKKVPTVVGGEVVTPATHVRCPSCAGWVPKLAQKCMHCGAAFVPTAAPPDGPRDHLADSRSGSNFGAFDSELDADVLARRMGQSRDRQ